MVVELYRREELPFNWVGDSEGAGDQQKPEVILGVQIRDGHTRRMTTPFSALPRLRLGSELGMTTGRRYLNLRALSMIVNIHMLAPKQKHLRCPQPKVVRPPEHPSTLFGFASLDLGEDMGVETCLGDETRIDRSGMAHIVFSGS